MVSDPTKNGQNGRDAKGKFVKGNPGGPGNPFARKVHRLRAALISAVTEEDIQEIVQARVKLAKNGDVAAAREVLSRTLGKPQEADLIERLSELEELVDKAQLGRVR